MSAQHRQLFEPDPKVTGTVERVTFQSPESGFCVLRVRDLRGALITVVGTAGEVSAGMSVEAQGQWIQDPKFGTQLKAEALTLSQPSTLEGMRRYLASGLVPGIGAGFAERLIEAFGNQVFEVIENEPERLREVDGIGPGRHRKILESWSGQKAVREIMVFLQGHGISSGLAARIYRRYGDESIERVKSDPYTLARDLKGVGFQGADRIARNLGLKSDSPARVGAGVEFALQEFSRQGHTAIERELLQQKAVELLKVDTTLVQVAVQKGLDSRRLLPCPRPEQVALPALHQAEKELAADLLRLAGTMIPSPGASESQILIQAEKETGLILAEGQKKALLMALHQRVMVITGGPGVGKTTVLKSILTALRCQDLKVVLCAPTGRAAKRLSESTGLKARTIHRLLDFNPGTGGFRHHRSHPLEGQVFVVDEFSMVDATLAWQLVRALPNEARLLMVGDVDQLPSVGPGRVLADVIESGHLPVARLDQIFRQAARSAIVTTAHLINQGQAPQTHSGNGGNELEDFYFIERDDAAEMCDLLVDLVHRRLPKRLDVDAINDIQVLTPMKRGELGTMQLNLKLQAVLNPQGKELLRQGLIWRLGDKVMQTSNNYDKDVFNGDIGRITAVDAEQEFLQVRFDGRVVDYAASELEELIHSFAVSIHKSQGSEFPVVVIPLHTQHYMLLQRNLLYTGVTRGRRLVVLLGSRRAVQMAVSRVESRQRTTLLKDFLESFGSPH